MKNEFVKRKFSEELVREFPNLVLLEPIFNDYLIGISNDGRGVYFKGAVLTIFINSQMEEFWGEIDEGLVTEAFFCRLAETELARLMNLMETEFGQLAPVMCDDYNLLYKLHRLSEGDVAEFYE